MTQQAETMRCFRCGRILPLSMFDKDPHGKNGLHRQCKRCRKTIRQEKKYRTIKSNNTMATNGETKRIKNTMRPERLMTAALVTYFQNVETEQETDKLSRIDIGKLLHISNSNIGNLSVYIENLLGGKECISADDFECIKEQAAEMLRDENESAKASAARKKIEDAATDGIKANLSDEEILAIIIKARELAKVI